MIYKMNRIGALQNPDLNPVNLVNPVFSLLRAFSCGFVEKKEIKVWTQY